MAKKPAKSKEVPTGISCKCPFCRRKHDMKQQRTYKNAKGIVEIGAPDVTCGCGEKLRFRRSIIGKGDNPYFLSRIAPREEYRRADRGTPGKHPIISTWS